MAILLRQSTASQEIVLGHFLDSTDGNSEETGLTIANTDIKLWKAGATTLANKNSGGGTHISNGIYYAVLDATDTNILGPMVVFCHVSGALAVRLECLVLPADVYDLLVANGTLEGSLKITDALRIILAVLAGESDGAPSSTLHFRDQADSKNRVTATVDADGNRSAITLDGS